MASNAPTIEKEKGSWLGFFAKVFFFLIVLFTIAIMVLMSLGGKSDVLKGSIEDYLSGRFGGFAQIETFNQMTFYPYLGIDMAGINVYEDEAKTKSRFSADKITAAMGFWDLAFSTGELKTLDIENLRAVPGTIIDKGLTMQRLAIIDEGDKAFIRGNGKIGASAFDVEAGVDKIGKGKKKTYKFGDIRPFKAKFGAVNINGIVENLDVDTMNIKNFSVGLQKPVFAGNLDIYYGGQERFKIKGDLIYGDNKSDFKPDILLYTVQAPKVTGSLDFNVLNLQDAQNYTQIVELYTAIQNVIGSSKMNADPEIDIKISAKKFMDDNIEIAVSDFWNSFFSNTLYSSFQNTTSDNTVCPVIGLKIANDINALECPSNAQESN